MTRPTHLRLLSAALALAAAGGAGAQALCSSDGQPPPTGVLERFVNADCAGCWTDQGAPRAAAGEVVLDWIVPGRHGDDAPLAAAARSEALDRLAWLRRAVPPGDAAHRGTRRGRPLAVRVARGAAVGDYVGASIELRHGSAAPLHAWLLLVEVLPAGTEGSIVERHLVRNALELSWKASPRGRPPSERRPMNIPPAADPGRLQVVGIVEDARGRIAGIAQSSCASGGAKG